MPFRRSQYRISALLCGVFAASICVAAIRSTLNSYTVEWKEEQREVEAIQTLGGDVTYDVVGPAWLRQSRLTTLDIFNRVTTVSLPITTQSLDSEVDLAKRLRQFRLLKVVILSGSVATTDASAERRLSTKKLMSELPDIQIIVNLF